MITREEVDSTRAELDRWLRAAGHDLAEPARTIRSFLDLLERRHAATLDAEAREYIGFATDAAARLETMLAALLEYGRVGREPFAPTPVDLAAVVERIETELVPLLAETGGRIEVGSLPPVEGSLKHWRRLMAILIDNALTYRGVDPPVVEIRAESGRITVADNGIGIEPRFHQRIFEPFQRLHTRDAIPGCGMGLTIARRIAQHQHCRLDVAPRDGGGSVFVVTLPGGQALSASAE